MRLYRACFVLMLPVLAVIAPVFVSQRNVPAQLVIPWHTGAVLAVVFLAVFGIIKKYIRTYNIPAIFAISPAIVIVFLVNGGIEAFCNVRYLFPYNLSIAELLFFLFIYYLITGLFIGCIDLCRDITTFYNTGQIKGWLLLLCDLGNMLNRLFNP